MRTWQLQDAKARLSEVIATAKKDGPQVITQRGLKTAVLVPFEQWEQPSKRHRFAAWKPGAPLTQQQLKENQQSLRLPQSAPDFEIPDRRLERLERR